MPKSIEYRTSAGQWDGAMPVVVASGEMSLSSAATSAGFMVPFDATIVSAKISVIASPDATAVVHFGTSSDADHYLTSGHTLANGAAVELVDVTASLTDTAVVAGEIIEFSTDGGATAAGLVGMAIVLSPNA